MMSAVSSPLALAAGSLLSPVIIGLHTHDQHLDLVDSALRFAGCGVPSTAPVLRLLLQGERKARDIAHNRSVFFGKDKAGDHLVRLCDQRGTEAASNCFPQWRWEVTARTRANASKAYGCDAPTMVTLVVTGFRLHGGVLDSAPALAVFRYLTVEGLRAVDPDLVVFGEPPQWRPEWWPDVNASDLAEESVTEG